MKFVIIEIKTRNSLLTTVNFKVRPERMLKKRNKYKGMGWGVWGGILHISMKRHHSKRETVRLKYDGITS